MRHPWQMTMAVGAPVANGALAVLCIEGDRTFSVAVAACFSLLIMSGATIAAHMTQEQATLSLMANEQADILCVCKSRYSCCVFDDDDPGM
ncbi:hypothetical protein L7F22_012449, partial [Adiantum nelumboides]|nr:hypothetical protein [Adiantum nelumboides]